MSRTVIKYGGSNLRKPEGIIQLFEISQEYKNPIIVVSALYGVTNFIQDYLTNNKFSKPGIRKFTDELYVKHSHFTKKLIQSASDQNVINKKINARLSELEHILLGVYYLKDLPPDLEAYILSFGERLSSLLISEYFKTQNLHCLEFLPENIGLIAKGEPKNAIVGIEASCKEVNKQLFDRSTVIIPGFYGITYDGKVRLFGRGGSDYSAACIANIVNATTLDIWKDVKGFKSSDPSVIPTASKLDTLTYDEAAELAYFGAKILHPRTVEPLVQKNIPIRFFSTKYSTDKPLTIINGKKHVSKNIIKSIASIDNYSILKLSGSGVGIRPGVLAKVTTVLHDKGINISSVITSQIAINLILEQKDIKKARQLIEALKLPVINELKIIQDISLLALVGHGMVEQYGIAARAFTVLANNGINVHLSSMGASEVTTYLVIDIQNKHKAINEIHKEFFNN